MKKLFLIYGVVALLLGGIGLLVPVTADAASAQPSSRPSTGSTARGDRPNTNTRKKVPAGKKQYTMNLSPRKATRNKNKKRSRKRNGKSATNKRHAGSFPPVAATWSDAVRHQKQANDGSGLEVLKRSRAGRNVTFRDQRASTTSDTVPRLERTADGGVRQRPG